MPIVTTTESRELPAPPMPPVPMPPAPMPPLPANPPRPWAAASNPSASTVQQAYMERREEELLAQSPMFVRMAYAVIEGYLAQLPGWKPFGVSRKEVKAAYDHINRAMQAADLTINIEAKAWFAQENPYDSYAQMYERGVNANGVMILKDNSMNDAETRASVDNRVTFPKEWTHAGTGGQRGLAPNTQSGARIMAQMNTGKLIAVNANDKSDGYHASNPRFNPRTKQVFAALNYARREHGGATGYGFSHFILNPELKSQAIYYPLDTFFSGRMGARAQVPHAHLASILAALGPKGPLARDGARLLQGIFDSCYHGKMPSPMEGPGRLLEAHIFSEIKFRDHVTALVLSPQSNSLSLPNVPFSTVVANAKKFAAKHGIKLYQAA